MLAKTLAELREAGIEVPDPTVFKPKQEAMPPKSSSFTVSVETITPAAAEAWLADRGPNRNTSGPLLRRFTDAIKQGDWVLNGESIKFDSDGHLIDGQHRLRAVITAQKPIESLVIRGLPTLARETVDIGHNRLLKDHLALRGEKSAYQLAAAVYELDNWHRRGVFGFGGARPGPQELIRMLDSNPHLRDWLPAGDLLRKHVGIPPGMSAAILYVFSQRDERLAQEFAQRLAYGDNLLPGSPILTLRNIFLMARNIKPHMTQRKRAEYLIRAWNALRTGKQLHQIRGEVSEFPKIR